MPVLRTVRAGRRTLLTVPADEATAAVGWATRLRDEDRIDDYALGPATLEDAYLSLTSSEGRPSPTDGRTESAHV